MLETFAHFVLGDHLSGFTFVPPVGDWGYERMMNPERRPYRTRDGYIGVNMYIDKHWYRFFELSGHPEMAQDARFVDVDARAKNMGLLYAYLAQAFETRTTGEWLELMTAADIPVVKMNTPETILEDPHMTQVGFFEEQEHPTEGLLRNLGIPQQWGENQPEQRYPAPRLGEHSVQLLSEYGFGQVEIDRLLAGHAVVAAD
jgi:formyl-CoA transferase